VVYNTAAGSCSLHKYLARQSPGQPLHLQPQQGDGYRGRRQAAAPDVSPINAAFVGGLLGIRVSAEVLHVALAPGAPSDAIGSVMPGLAVDFALSLAVADGLWESHCFACSPDSAGVCALFVC